MLIGQSFLGQLKGCGFKNFQVGISSVYIHIHFRNCSAELVNCKKSLFFLKTADMTIMVVRVVEFSSRGYKLERFLSKNQHIQRKFLNFENWCSGELSKIGHHFSNQVIQKLMLSKNVNDKK